MRAATLLKAWNLLNAIRTIHPPPTRLFLEKRLQADENKGRACEKRGEKRQRGCK
jgi:hypothetical protein